MVSQGLAFFRGTGDRAVLAQHRANLLANLDRRLAIAKASGNQYLQTLLEGERQQLREVWEPPVASLATPISFQRLWQNLLAYLKEPLEVEYVTDRQGRSWWYAFDHHSGKKLFAETEADVIAWIEENRLGS